MSIQTRRILIAVLVLLSSLCFLGVGPSAPASSMSDKGLSGAVEGGSVLVEAFVVEVNLPALTRAGVSQIGQGPCAATVGNILTCLEGGQARVTAGNKIAARSSASASVRVERTGYSRRVAPGPQRDYRPYSSGGRLAATVTPMADKTFSAGFTFETAQVRPRQTDVDVPPQTENWEWSGSVVLPLGVPQIAGAVQDGDTAVFLLLVANAPGV